MSVEQEGGVERDVVLLRRARAGDREAFASLAESYRPRLFRFCSQKLGNPQDAQDAVQTTFLKALRKFDQVQEEHRFKPWIYKVAKNVCMDMHRDGGGQSQLSDDFDPPATSPSPGEGLRVSEISEIVGRSMNELSSIQRDALFLRHFEEMDYADIAEVLGVSEGTVRKRVHDALRSLGRALENYRNLL